VQKNPLPGQGVVYGQHNGTTHIHGRERSAVLQTALMRASRIASCVWIAGHELTPLVLLLLLLACSSASLVLVALAGSAQINS